MRMNRRASEPGFTIVEVIVAAIVLTTVMAGAVYFVAGAGRSQERSASAQKMAAYADEITQRMRADQEWLRPGNCAFTSDRCAVRQAYVDSIAPSEAKYRSLTATVAVQRRDSASDGVGAGVDEDGLLTDFYDITVEVKMSSAPGEAPIKPFVSRSNVDASALGMAAGTLVLQLCEVQDQSDERMSVSNCDGVGSMHQMKQQPNGCVSPSLMTAAQMSDLSTRPVLGIGCNDAFNAAVNGPRPDHARVRVKRASQSIESVRLTWDGPGSTPNDLTLDDALVVGSTYVFEGVPAGRWKLQVEANEPSWEHWRSQSIPASDALTIQANEKVRALVMMRPAQGKGATRVTFSRDTYHYRIYHYTDTVVRMHTVENATLKTVFTYHYLKSRPPIRDRTAGASWSGVLAMEPKPFDRYRDPDPADPTSAGFLAQRAFAIGFKTPFVDILKLPVGLHSLPTQHQEGGPSPVVPTDANLFGSFGTRQLQCPSGTCPAYIWMDKEGRSNTKVNFHDGTKGECYKWSTVSGFQIPRWTLTGSVDEAHRCDRVLRWPQGGKPHVSGFFPDRNGSGGRRELWYMEAHTTCIGNVYVSCSGGGSTGAIGANGSGRPNFPGTTVTVTPLVPPGSPPGTTPDAPRTIQQAASGPLINS